VGPPSNRQVGWVGRRCCGHFGATVVRDAPAGAGQQGRKTRHSPLGSVLVCPQLPPGTQPGQLPHLGERLERSEDPPGIWRDGPAGQPATKSGKRPTTRGRRCVG